MTEPRFSEQALLHILHVAASGGVLGLDVLVDDGNKKITVSLPTNEVYARYVAHCDGDAGLVYVHLMECMDKWYGDDVRHVNVRVVEDPSGSLAWQGFPE